MSPLAYRRVLLKLSGEALMGDEDYGIDPKVIGRLAREVVEAQQAGAEVGVVIGGGNIFRGAGLAAGGMDRVTGDQMGMLATVINALAMQDALEKLGARVRVMSAIKINDVCEDYIRRQPFEPAPPALLQEQRAIVPALAHGAWTMARDTNASLVAVWSQSGGTAQSLSRNGFRIPILAFSTDTRAVRRMTLYYAVTPFKRDRFPLHRFEFGQMIDRMALEEAWANRGDIMILLAGMPFDKPGGANTVAVRRVGDLPPGSMQADG